MILSTLPGDTTPCTSSACSAAHPYYFVTSGFKKADAANRMLHRLCSWLNHSGQESWIITTDTHPSLWTPKVHDQVRAQHHAANKCPIVVYVDKKIAGTIKIGLKVHYQFDAFSGLKPVDFDNDALTFSWRGNGSSRQLRLPFIDLKARPDSASRTQLLVFADAYLAAGNATTDLPPDALRITHADLTEEDALLARLASAHTLYMYEPSVLGALARAQGCAVVEVRNTTTWPANDDVDALSNAAGLVTATHWLSAPPLPIWQAADFVRSYMHCMEGWHADVARFVAQTQAAAAKVPWAQVWPEDIVLTLPVTGESLQAAAWRVDRIKQLRINQQLAQWASRSTLREIDGEIYGRYVVSGQLPPIAVVIYANNDINALADTMDSLSNGLLAPSELTVVSTQPSPFGEDTGGALHWVQLPSGWDSLEHIPQASTGPLGHVQAPWILAVRAGATLQPNAIVEFAIMAQHTTSAVVYADEDVLSRGKPQYPHFKPHANIEWLRSTNYLGDVVLVQSRGWKKHSESHCFEGVYAFALRALEKLGRAGLAHIDTLLVHGSGTLTDAQLNTEQRQLRAHLTRLGLSATVKAGSVRGLRDIAYSPRAQQVSLVVPCATQVGYLTCLLHSLATHSSSLLHEVLVVADTEFAARVESAVKEARAPFTTRIVVLANQPYSHAKALNAGAAQATGDILLFADDDTELLHNQWLEPMCALFNQPDIAAVAPRLVKPGSPDPIMAAGPAFLGLGGLFASYCGEKGNVLESGPYGRLQATQDVSAFAPNFFLMRAQHFKLAGGFDETELPLFLPVLDLALKASGHGLRHVWCAQVSVLHHGGKTLEERQRWPEDLLSLRQAELKERQSLLARWAEQLGADPLYNRNLSLSQPFDLEQDIVIDWQPNRRDRPRTVALPLSSGSGQYRVIEPLNALQNEGKAQSCVVFPINRDVARVPNSIELVRSGVDRLIVQNAIGDLQLARLEEYRVNLPKLGIVHMLDDLFGNLPGKHHLHNYHKREGNTRLRRALELSDRLVVTTEPLKEYYEDFVPETRVIPNALVESTWFDLPVTRRARTGKLRVGWAGAQQHLGDLDMIQAVVAHFGNKVDWVFMGMCPPSIQPHVKEVHPFVSIDVYPQTLTNLDLDIAIAPLEHNHFNACKSNLRLLEYGAMGWPVVCSDVYPFRTDDPPVSRVPNDVDAWIAALDTLIASDTLRTDMGKQLNHWVKTRYALSVHTEAWFKAIFDPINR